LTIKTPRLRLRPWQDDDRAGFAALHGVRIPMNSAGDSG
jgi:hypothetical protein